MDAQMVHKLFRTLLLSFCLLAASRAGAEITIEDQRRAFLSARQALERNDLKTYHRLENSLKDYALFPYLRYDYLRSRLTEASTEEIRDFLATYADAPVAGQLRRAWLTQLARQKRWTDFLKDYSDGLDIPHRCHFVYARLQQGADAALWQEVERLWLTGRSQPGECDALFAQWRKTGFMTRDKLLARVELAMQKGEKGLVDSLAASLPAADRPWVPRWQRLHKSPETEIKRLEPGADPFWSAKLFAYGVRRLADRDPELADVVFAKRETYDLTAEQTLLTERSIAMGLAFQRHPDAAKRLGALAGTEAENEQVRQWRVRAALWQQDWPAVLAALDRLSGVERLAEEWQYWRARALEATGRTGEAQAQYESAAARRSFYGFLAASRLMRRPAITSVPLDIGAAEVDALRATAPMTRLRELEAVGLAVDARREWRDALSRLDERGLRTAAKLAYEWGWYDQAILALGRTDAANDLEVRFPTPYQQEVITAAEHRRLDPAFVFAVMRQESAFGAQARSPVGALGLMQLMPDTAKRTARHINLPVRNSADILKTQNNIRLGTAYLSGLLEKYDGNRMFALAAYNAGPNRVERWRPDRQSVPADIWVANITYAETREYVQRILTYTAIYQWRLGRDVTPVTAWLPDVKPRLIQEAGDLTAGAKPG